MSQNPRTDNVTELFPPKHYRFEIYVTRRGYIAEGHENGDILWEYKTESLGKLSAMMLMALAQLDDPGE